MSTPTWKKRLILIVGLLEVLVFSGTIFGWTGLVYMLKSEGVYQYICDEVNHNVQSNDVGFNNTSAIGRKPMLKRNANEGNSDFVDKLKTLNKEVIGLLLAEQPLNGSNASFLEQLESYQIEPSFSPKYVSV